MLMQEVTTEMLEEWKHIYNEYRTRLLPNRKTSDEVIAYLKSKYPMEEVKDDKWNQIVIRNVMGNECFAEKLPTGRTPKSQIFAIPNKGTAKVLYEKQDQIFCDQLIFVGIELETAFLQVEGSSALHDELFAFRGLDEKDLNNFFLVAKYVTCLKKFGMLESVLNNYI